MSVDCLFCEEIKTDANIFYQSESGDFVARWDQVPVAPGHFEIVPARHMQYMSELLTHELQGIMLAAREATDILHKTDLGKLYKTMQRNPVSEVAARSIDRVLDQTTFFRMAPEGHTVAMNDGPAAGQSIPHVHLHIIPRWQSDVPNPRGGIRNIFQDDEYSGLRSG